MNKLIVSSLFVCSLFISCTQSEEENPVITTEGQVCFTGSVGASSRATAFAFEMGDSISLFAFRGEGNPWSEGNAPSFTNIKYGYNGTLFTTHKGGITYPENTPLSFSAVYPAITSTTSSFNFYVEEDQSLDENYTKSDLMTAFATRTSEPVPNLIFNHRLSSVVMNLTFEQMPAGTTHVSFSSAKTVGVDLAADTYTGTGGNILAIRAAGNGTNSYKAVLPPQTIKSGWEFINITTEGGQVYRYALPAEVILKSGKQRTFNLTVTATGKVILTTEKETDFGGKLVVRPSNGSADITFIYQPSENSDSYIVDTYFYYNDYTKEGPFFELEIVNYSPQQHVYEGIDCFVSSADISYPSFYGYKDAPYTVSAKLDREEMNVRISLSGQGSLETSQTVTIPADIVSCEWLFPLSFEGTMKSNIQNINDLNIPNIGFDLPFPIDEAMVITKGGKYTRGGEFCYKEGSIARYNEMKQKIVAAGYTPQEEEEIDPANNWRQGIWIKDPIIVYLSFDAAGFGSFIDDGTENHFSIAVVEKSNTKIRSISSFLPHRIRTKK